ncbi:MAG: restriction endonuclease subunit S [Gammaproteobacteria bacterium]|nr:MAG: restriction endonuclease subunit S [Gammaproteobacteria bacterium]
MESEWPSYPLEQLCAANTAITYGVVKPGPEDSNGVLFVRGGDIINGQINLGQLRTITHEVSQQYKRTLLKGGEILVSLVGNPGQVAIAPAVLRGANIARQVGLIRLREDIDKQFIKYYLLSPLGQRELSGYSLGSVQQVINLQDLKRVEIPLPTLEEQKAIAHILGTLDDKIELNRQMNATLEAMAQALFKSWFVDFDPVIDNALAAGNPIPPELQARAEKRAALGDNRKPLPSEIQQLFPDRFTFTDEMGWVPEGWEGASLSEFGQIVCGKTPSKSNPEYFGSKIPFIKIPDMHNEMFVIGSSDYLSEAGAATQPKKAIPRGSVCVSCIATVGKVVIASQESHTNQQINSIVPNDTWLTPYLYFYMLTLNKLFHDLASGGSTTLNMNTGVFSKIEINRPNDSVLKAFHKETSPMTNKIEAYLMEIDTLVKLRDTLLPKLLSGQLRIPEAEQQVAEVL